MIIKSKILVLSILVVAFTVVNCQEVVAAEVFHSLAIKTGMFAEGLRKLAYVISGFGIIMFTFLAICGKINFKHLGYIVMSLFFLSGMGALITYIKGGNAELTYNFDDTYTAAVRPDAGRITSSGGGSSLGASGGSSLPGGSSLGALGGSSLPGGGSGGSAGGSLSGVASLPGGAASLGLPSPVTPPDTINVPNIPGSSSGQNKNVLGQIVKGAGSTLANKAIEKGEQYIDRQIDKHIGGEAGDALKNVTHGQLGVAAGAVTDKIYGVPGSENLGRDALGALTDSAEDVAKQTVNGQVDNLGGGLSSVINPEINKQIDRGADAIHDKIDSTM